MLSLCVSLRRSGSLFQLLAFASVVSIRSQSFRISSVVIARERGF